jgi:acyl carrier protein
MTTINLAGHAADSGLSDRPSAEAIQERMITYLAQQLQLKSEEIDPKLSFEHYGIDSVVAVSLIGELEDQLRRRLSPTLPYDYPTIEALAEHLAQPAEI